MLEVKNLLTKLAAQDLQGLVLVALNEQGDLETCFFGNIEKQALLKTIAETSVSLAIHEAVSARMVPTKNYDNASEGVHI